jgi:hypothetical protein
VQQILVITHYKDQEEQLNSTDKFHVTMGTPLFSISQRLESLQHILSLLLMPLVLFILD